MTINIPRISGIDPKVAKILQPIKLALEELISGDSRAVRVDNLRSGFNLLPNGFVDFDPIVIPSVEPLIRARLEQLQAVQTDVSTLAEELLGNARFGTLIGDSLSQVYSLKVNVNGHIAGYGVAAYAGAEGQITSDFIIQADRFSVVFPSPPWLPSQAYSLGQYVTGTPASGVGNIIFEVTTAGTTGTTEPAWNTTPGNTTASGTAVFTARTIDERVPFVVGNVGGVATVGIDGNLLVDGTIEALAIQAGSITTDKLAAQAVTAEKIAANLVLSQAIEISSTGYIRSGQSAFDTGTGWFLGANSGTPVFSIGNSGGNKVTWNGTTLTVIGNVSGALDAGSLVGTVPPSNFDISTLGWTIDSTFAADDADTVSWTAGTLYTAAGDTFSIAAGDTGNMTARTYIYLDIAVSSTVLQTTTTAANAVGAGRILVAVAEDDATTAFFQVFGGSGSFGASSPDIPSFGPLRNGDFELNDTTGWISDASWTVESQTLVTGSYAAHIATSTTGARSAVFPAAPGDRFLVTCIAARDGSSLPDAPLRLSLRWDDGTFSSEATAAEGTSGNQFLRLLVTVPAGIVSAQVCLRKTTGSSGHWYADDVFVTPAVVSSDIAFSGVTGTVDLATQISGTLTTTFAAAGLINTNVTINANGTLSGAGGGQASLNSLPGAIALGSQVSGTLSTSFAAAGLINTNVVMNADGTLTGAGGGQASLNNLPGAISAGQINANAVTTAKLDTAAVTAAKITAGTITANEIAAATITGNRIAANTIAGANIIALTITAAEIAAGSITTLKIATQAVTANEIAANTITSGQIAAATIVASNIAAGTITAVNIATGTISTNELAANAVTANTIATGAVTAAKLAVTIAYAGEIIIDPAGMIRSGQSAFNVGTGWFLGNSSGTPVFSIGNPAGNRVTWDGSTLTLVGNLAGASESQNFLMTMNAGGANGSIDTRATRTGGQVTVTFTTGASVTVPATAGSILLLSTLPVAFRPAQQQIVAFWGLLPYSTVLHHLGRAVVRTDGNIEIWPAETIASGGVTWIRVRGFLAGTVGIGSPGPTITYNL